MHPATPVMMTLFAGYTEAFGLFIVNNERSAQGKINGKATTVRGSLTVDHWDNHLNGVAGIGIIPINADNQCSFGVIDVDKYDINIKDVAIKVDKLGLPLTAIRSKSGGVHLYVFLTEPVPAKIVQDKLREFSAALGLGICEIFPKQTKVLYEKGDIGQWINMPYFDETKTTRYALGPDQKALLLKDFIKFAEARRITPKAFIDLKIANAEELIDGPPCLQLLALQGFPPGTRNNGLLNLAVYLRKLTPDNWKAELDKYNKLYMIPALPSAEVLAVIKSMEKKEYNYTCKQDPICAHCNVQLCRTRKYGIGGGLGMPSMGSLTKLMTDPPIWFLEVDHGGRLELSTDDLQSPFKFQKRCMDALNMMPVVMKREDWQDIVRRLLDEVQVINMPEDVSMRGQLIELIEVFCTGRAQANREEEILLGKPYLFDGHHLFRLTDLQSFLERHNFTVIGRNKMISVMRDLGAKHQFLNIKGKGVNVWSLPEMAKQTSKFKPPEQADAPI